MNNFSQVDSSDRNRKIFMKVPNSQPLFEEQTLRQWREWSVVLEEEKGDKEERGCNFRERRRGMWNLKFLISC